MKKGRRPTRLPYYPITISANAGRALIRGLRRRALRGSDTAGFPDRRGDLFEAHPAGTLEQHQVAVVEPLGDFERGGCAVGEMADTIGGKTLRPGGLHDQLGLRSDADDLVERQ